MFGDSTIVVHEHRLETTRRIEAGGVARALRDRLTVRRQIAVWRRIIEFEYRRVEHFDQWDVQDVEPDHRFIALIAMVVPLAVGGQDKIPAAGGEFLAADRRIATAAHENEPAGGWCVPVDRRGLAWIVERVGREQ